MFPVSFSRTSARLQATDWWSEKDESMTGVARGGREKERRGRGMKGPEFESHKKQSFFFFFFLYVIKHLEKDKKCLFEWRTDSKGAPACQK